MMSFQEERPGIAGEIKVVIPKGSNIGAVRDKINESISLQKSTSEVLELILSGALSVRASDIHFEPAKESAKIRFRIDGMLSDVVEIPKEEHRLITNRIKLLSHMRLNISDIAQDGRFTIALEGDKNIEIRSSSNPSEYGETIVLRILDPEAVIISIADLGLRKDDEESIKRILKKPNGMVLVTGPTGSGKTTTLYSFLKSVHSPEIKIITIEDPIEYHLAGVQQTQVDEEAGYDFANGLRSLLRQDPDVILVGEIRDYETADTASQAALTGHIVFSTLHTNSASGAIPRLINFGLKVQVMGPSLSAIIAQRLVRNLCSECKKKIDISEELKAKISGFIENLPQEIDRTDIGEPSLFEPVGCAKCNNGYAGRTGIFEIIEITKEFESLIHKDASEVEIIELARKYGFASMQEDGIIRALKGEIDLLELERVTGPIDWSSNK